MRFFLFIALLFSFSDAARAQNALIYDFSAPKPDPKLSDFAAPYAAPGGVAASVAVELKNGALNFSNRAGGSFGVKFNLPPFDANRFPTLELDYTRSQSTKINFFLKVNGSYYGVIFSGPPRVRPGSFLLGAIPNVASKGRISIPLRDWLRRFQPGAEKLQVEEVLAGNWDNAGYLLAGIGGNGPGATWSLTRLALLPAQNAPLRFQTPFFEGNRLIWPLENGDLDTTQAVLEVDGTKYPFTSPFLRLETILGENNSLSRRVIFDAGNAGLTFSDAQKLELKLEGAAQTLNWKRDEHVAAVPLPRLEWDENAPFALDFETDLQGVEPKNAIVQLDSQSFASGQNSLQLFNPRTASLFDAAFKITALDAQRFPFLTFAYRNDSRLRLDFHLRWDGKFYFVRMADRDGAQIKLGAIDNVPDGQWHHATIPLLEWMKRARPDATGFKLETLSLSDDAWLGNARGVTFHLDDLRVAPLLSGALKAEVTLRDVSDVTSVSFGIDQMPTGEVDTASEGGADLDISLAGRAPGLYFLHLRAKNGAGNWSEAAHFPFAVK